MIAAQQFLEAFSAAAHDAYLERKNKFQFYHFFDSDFIGRLVFGYRDERNRELISNAKNPDDPAGYQLLVGSLMGRGLGSPPNMRVLSPHLYEIRVAAGRSWVKEERRNYNVTVDLLDLRDVLQTLREELHRGGGDAALKQFLAYGPTPFYGVELLSATWEARLAALLRLGIHEKHPFDFVPDVFAGRTFEFFGDRVASQSEDRRGGLASGVRDAMALAMLATGINRLETEEGVLPVARFHTETPRIVRAWNSDSKMRELLTYPVQDDDTEHLDGHVHGVMRNTYYYLIRTLIPELRYRPQVAETPSQAKEATSSPESLPTSTEEPSAYYAIGLQLKEAAQQLRKGGLTEAELSDVRVGDATLGDYMAEVTDISSYNLGWQRLMQSALPGLRDTLGQELADLLEERRDKQSELEASLGRHLKDLSDRTEDVAEFTSVYVEILDALQNFKGEMRPAFGGYREHFGLARWGYGRDDVDEAALEEFAREFAGWSQARASGGEAQHNTALAMRLATQVGLLGSKPVLDPQSAPTDCSLLGFLWFIEDYAGLCDHGKRFLTSMRWVRQRSSRTRPGVPSAPPEQRHALLRIAGATENLLAAAKVHVEAGKLENSAIGRAELVAVARDLSDSLAKPRRQFPTKDGARAITQGYILFHAWQAVNPVAGARGLSGQHENTQRDLAVQSLDIGREALRSDELEPESFSLLVNHCLYVATVTRAIDVAGQEATDWSRMLLLCADTDASLWSYRFDDTLAYFYMVRAEEQWLRAKHHDQDGLDRLVAVVLGDLEESRRWLARVPDTIHDREVEAHRRLWHHLEAEVTRQQLELEPRHAGSAT